jgi:hypothetical protein
MEKFVPAADASSAVHHESAKSCASSTTNAVNRWEGSNELAAASMAAGASTSHATGSADEVVRTPQSCPSWWNVPTKAGWALLGRSAIARRMVSATPRP